MVCLYTFSNLFSFLLKITSHPPPPPLPTFREKKRETECPFKDSFEWITNISVNYFQEKMGYGLRSFAAPSLLSLSETSEGQRLTSDVQDSG